MEQTPCEGTALAFIDAAVCALEEARRLLQQKDRYLAQNPGDSDFPITAAYLSLDHSLDGFGH